MKAKLLIPLLLILPLKSNATAILGGNINNVNKVDSVSGVNNIGKLADDQSVDNLDQHLRDELKELEKFLNKEEAAREKTMAHNFEVLDTSLANKRVEQQTAQRVKSSAPGQSSCHTVTGVFASGHGAQDKRNMAIQQSYDSNHILNSGYNSPSQAGARYGDVSRWRIHCKLGATEEEVQAGLCSNVNSSTKEPTYKNADKNAPQKSFASDSDFSTIWNAPNGVIEDTQSQDGENPKLKAQLFMEHAFHDRPLGPLTPTTRHDLIAKQEEMAHRYSTLSSRSIAEMPMREIMSEEMRNSMERNWGSATANQTIGMIGLNSGDAFDNGMSQQGFKQLMARHWFFNPQWELGASTEMDGQVLKDMVHMSSWNTYQIYEIEHENQLTNLLLGQILHYLNLKRNF